MPRKTRKTHYAPLSLTDKSEEILDIYVKEKDYLSRSEAVRHCIQFAYDKEFPGYINKLTPAAEIKKRKLDQVKTFEQMSPEDYAESLKALILTDQQGQKWAFFHQMGNSAKGFLLEDLKSLDSNEGFKSFIAFHKEKLKEHPITWALEGKYMENLLLTEYDIVYSDDRDKRDDNSHPGLPTEEQDSGVEAERPSDSGNSSGTSDWVSAGEQSGTAGSNGDTTADGEISDDRDQDGEGQTEASSDSVSPASEKLRSHGPSHKEL